MRPIDQVLARLDARLDTCHDLQGVMVILVHDLCPLFPVDHLGLFLHDPTNDVMRLHFAHASFPSDTQPTPGFPVDASPSGHVFTTQRPLLIPNVADDARWPHVLALLSANGVREFCVFPLTAGPRRLGALAFGFRRPGQTSRDDQSFLQPLTDVVARAVARLLPYPP